MCRSICVVMLAALTLLAAGRAANAAPDPNVLCHKTVVKQLEKYKKTHLKLARNCLDKENKGTIAGSCLDPVSSAKRALAQEKVTVAIAKKCSMTTLAAIGYRADCQYGPATAGIGGTCAPLPVTTPTEFAACMECWKGAEFARVEGTLYASHALEVCGGALDDTSPRCANLGCTTPQPDQRDLGDTAENDCQRMIAKAGMNYLLKREHFLEQCLLKGGTRASCLADLVLQLKLAKLETQKETLILKKCANRDPVPAPPFCCKSGMGNACVAATSRDDCTMNLSGTVQEGKTCNAGSCAPAPGNKSITWWGSCPSSASCPGPALGDINGLIGCVDAVADGTVDRLLCLQFPNAGACPP